MDNTLLIGLSQQVASYNSMDVISSNLANVSTPGFKRESTKFEEYISRAQPGEGENGPQSVSLVQQAGTMRDMTGGRIEMTKSPYDIALNGKGYFVVQTANGPRYTRNGHFTLDAGGRLVTGDGDPVQGDGGDITVSPDDGIPHVAQDGTVAGLKGQIGKLQIVQFDNETPLVKQGSSLYATTQPAQPATNAKLQQGAIESSNVEPVIEISHMIEIMRAYQATATLTQSQEDLKRAAIDKIASTQN
jgi:flagellar basal-body rod protein FlgF